MTTEMKHSEGPWRINTTGFNTDHHGAGFSIEEEEGDGFYIATIEDIDPTVNQANAKLIAASPSLLEACIWAVGQFKILADKGLYPEHLLTENGGNGVMPLVNAIKKATE